MAAGLLLRALRRSMYASRPSISISWPSGATSAGPTSRLQSGVSRTSSTGSERSSALSRTSSTLRRGWPVGADARWAQRRSYVARSLPYVHMIRDPLEVCVSGYQ